MSTPVALDVAALTAFLNARLGEDEAAAKGAVPGPWRWGDWSTTFGAPEMERNTLEHSPEHGPFPAPERLRGVRSDGVLRLEDALETDPDQEASGLHIARHDPARVLREVEAKRKLLARHEEDRHAPGQCSNCFDALGRHLAWPCPTIRIVATVYSDHPDFRQEWSP